MSATFVNAGGTVSRRCPVSAQCLTRGAARKEGILEQDVDRLSGEPVRLAAENPAARRVAAALTRSSTIRWVLVREWDTSSDSGFGSSGVPTVGVEVVMNNAGWPAASVQAFQMTERLSYGTVSRIDLGVSYREKRKRGAETK